MSEINQDDYPQLSAAWWVARGYRRTDPARQGFFQVLSRYNRARGREDYELANRMFEVEPPVTGVEILDKGIAAAALYYHQRDGIPLAEWVSRRAVPMDEPWGYTSVGEEALHEFMAVSGVEDLGFDSKRSPAETLVSRGILLTHNDMDG